MTARKPRRGGPIVPLQLDTCSCGHHQALAAAEKERDRYKKALEEIVVETGGSSGIAGCMCASLDIAREALGEEK